MNKDELVETIAIDAGITKAAAARALASFCDRVGEALATREEVVLPGFGRFDAVVDPAHPGRNPRTGETIQIAATARPRFRAGIALKRRLKPLAAAFADAQRC